MATYGRGQMLGSGINPESFKLDFSGFADAAATQAQGVASIGGAISEVGDYFKKQKEDEQKVQKSLSVAKAIGDLIPGLQPTIKGSLDILNDKEIPLSQRKAEADAIADILNLGINEVRNRQDVGLRERALAIQEAQFEAENAPPMPAPLTYKRATNVPYGGGFLDNLLIGSDGQYYDEARNLVADIGAFARGESPEVYSGYSNFSDDLGSIDTPTVFMPGENPAANGVLPPKEEIAQLERQLGIDENKRKEIQSSISPKKSRIRFDADKKELQEPVTITIEKLNELSASGVRAEGSLNPDGTFSVTGFKTGSLPQGMTIESDGQGGFKMTQGAVGGKAERVAKAQEQMKGESFRLNQSNTEEAFKRLDTAGTNNPVFAAGNALMAEVLPASETGELAGFYERINDENSFIKMNQQRASSLTGGMAGSMTEKEWPKYQGRFSPLKVNAKKDTIAKSLSLNLLNAFEAINGTPDEVIKLLDEKKIDQATYDNYVSDYVRNRQIARVNANGVEGKSYDWTKLNKKLLSKSTIFEAPASSIPRSEEIEAIRKKYLTPNAQ
jgi:hypothetical protein